MGPDVPQGLESRPPPPDAVDEERFVEWSGKEQGGEKVSLGHV